MRIKDKNRKVNESYRKEDSRLRYLQEQMTFKEILKGSGKIILQPSP